MDHEQRMEEDQGSQPDDHTYTCVVERDSTAQKVNSQEGAVEGVARRLCEEVYESVEQEEREQYENGDPMEEVSDSETAKPYGLRSKSPGGKRSVASEGMAEKLENAGAVRTAGQKDQPPRKLLKVAKRLVGGGSLTNLGLIHTRTSTASTIRACTKCGKTETAHNYKGEMGSWVFCTLCRRPYIKGCLRKIGALPHYQGFYSCPLCVSMQRRLQEVVESDRLKITEEASGESVTGAARTEKSEDKIVAAMGKRAEAINVCAVRVRGDCTSPL